MSCSLQYLSNLINLAVTNRYEHLLNLQDTQEDNVQPVIQGQYEFCDSPYGVQLQNVRDDDVKSGTHGLENTSATHGDNKKHLQLQRNDPTNGKEYKKIYE